LPELVAENASFQPISPTVSDKTGIISHNGRYNRGHPLAAKAPGTYK
jgi:hypothetical protein